MPGQTVGMMADGAVGRGATGAVRAQAAAWVTALRRRPSSIPAGDYPNQSDAGAGHPRSGCPQERPLTDADVVLWYTVGMNHVATPEDWPVAPVHRAGFTMKPWGFFDRNPGLDVPMPEHCAHEHEEEDGHGGASSNGRG